MSFYAKLRVNSFDTPEIAGAKKRGSTRLLALKQELDKVIPSRAVDGNLLLATWNIREFGEGRFRGWTGEKGKAAGAAAANEDEGMKGRFQESIYYLAEIVERFDLVALQEVRDDLEDLNLLRDLLGGWWKILVTDVTAGQQGNRERVAFLYDERKVKFGGLAGEVVLPPEKKGVPAFQLARTPYIVGFKAGWFSFTICSTHLFYGESKADDPQRLKEMDLLAGFLAAEVKRSTAWSKNMILLGDFNIFTTADAQYKVLTTKHGFTVPKTMIGKATNTGANHPYDQIAFIAPSLTDQLELSKSGVFPFFDYVFTDADEKTYAAAMGDGYIKDSKGKVRDAKSATNYYRKWRTYQMSDHNPLWIELSTDFSSAYLKHLAKP
ncbi:MAG: endonuclease/exonuclease/phosphatase family protein [Opitutaceae bacterium]|nr:endonuclease/exonuclease/phosphatase family protein [Opitutaceae bacterium]